ncbi:MAG: hypothetical protein JNK26_01215 [Candidatus Doudnabacteria bacterium]|nr:hypothetical protein [Candidatus Doudnabacteria bacterium]
MLKGFEIAKTTFLVLMLFGIMTAAFVSTLALSPIATNLNDTQVAGISSEGEILSNFIPLSIQDTNTTSDMYQTQLVEVSPRAFNYFAKVAFGDKQEISPKFIAIKNDNSSTVTITVSAIVPQSVQSALDIFVVEPGRTHSVADDQPPYTKSITLDVPAGQTLELGLTYFAVRAINFPVDIAFQLTY